MCIFSVYSYCAKDKEPLRCWVGDLTSKLGRLNVAGKIQDLSSTKMFFTDSNLPLTGDASIIGHSLVIHDDHAPAHRGERMACTAVRRLYRHKECFTTSLYLYTVISRHYLYLALLFAKHHLLYNCNAILYHGLLRFLT